MHEEEAVIVVVGINDRVDVEIEGGFFEGAQECHGIRNCEVRSVEVAIPGCMLADIKGLWHEESPADAPSVLMEDVNVLEYLVYFPGAGSEALFPDVVVATLRVAVGVAT